MYTEVYKENKAKVFLDLSKQILWGFVVWD